MMMNEVHTMSCYGAASLCCMSPKEVLPLLSRLPVSDPRKTSLFHQLKCFSLARPKNVEACEWTDQRRDAAAGE